MDLIKDVMDDVARECGVAVPSVWSTNVDDTPEILKMYLRQASDELLSRIDWQRCTYTETITGSGSDTYALPSDFKRPTRGPNSVYGNAPHWSYIPVTSNGDWTQLLSWGAGSTYYYRFLGNSIQFSQVINSPDTISVAFVSKNWVDDSGTPASSWTSDSQETYLPGELLRLGTIWRWKRKMGLDYDSIQGEYETEITRASNDDRASQLISFGKVIPDRLITPYDLWTPPLLNNGQN